MNNDMQDMNDFLQSIIDNLVIDSNNEIETNEIDSNNEVETNEIDSNEDDVYIPCEICMNNVLSKYYYFHLYLYASESE